MNKNNSLLKQPIHTPGFFSVIVRHGVPSPAARSRCCSSQPAGYTLMEMLATLSLLSTLAIASVTIINTLAKDGIESAHGRQSRRDVHRLASSLREDSTRTARLSPGNLNWPVTLTHESSQTVYDWNQPENSLTRTETAGQSPLLSERFLLPTGSKPEMTAGPGRLTLRINLPGENNSWIIEGNLNEGSSEQ